MKEIFVTKAELARINELTGPQPDPVTGTRAQERRFKRRVVRAVGEVLGPWARADIRGVEQVKVSIVRDPVTEQAEIAAYVYDRFTDR